MQVHTSSFLLMQQNLGTDINYAEITNSLCSFSAELLKKNLVFALIRKILLHLNTVMLRYNLPCKIKYIPSLDYRLLRSRNVSSDPQATRRISDGSRFRVRILSGVGCTCRISLPKSRIRSEGSIQDQDLVPRTSSL